LQHQPFETGTACQDEQGTLPDMVCINTAPAAGPALPFFEPCQGAAYTYADDNKAVAACTTNIINCCLGKACTPDTRQSNQ
ncbi:MAG: hypothetical protein MMC33_002306, partial [Icmadophila ericetorum]|nr:hypothetical protein [Icmadophila ericetorum]